VWWCIHAATKADSVRIWFGIFPFSIGGEIRQFLVVEDFGAVPDNSEPLPWLDPHTDEK